MSGGVGAALGEAMEAAEADAEEVLAAVQGALDLGVEETGALDTPSPFSQTLAPKKGPGRRPGSRNVRTAETMKWILAQHRHPLSVICEAYSMTPAEFAAKIGLPKPWVEVVETVDEKKVVTGRRFLDDYDADTLLEIVKLQLRMAEAALPYLAQKQPMAVQLEGKAALTVAFEGVSLPARGGSAGDFQPVEGDGLALRLPYKSDAESRTDS